MLFLTTLGMSNWVFAQQDAQYTQYMYNPMNVNPAYAGSRDALSIFGMHRTQWVGLEGAPTTNVFSIHTPLKNERLGLGLSIVNDKIGPSSENSIRLLMKASKFDLPSLGKVFFLISSIDISAILEILMP